MREYEGNAPKADSSPIEADGTISVTKKLSDPNHPAIDVGQANGQKVRSMYDGKITFAAKADSDQADGKDIGGWITVESYRKDGTTFAARYLHNGPLLEAGTYVTAGTAIGETRQPGSPSYGGNHIHIEIHTSDAGLSSKGATVDPSTVLKAWLP
jgi:murein DD-endopeptidase MepM/ murein hydrolase activator NlpD